MLDKIIGKLLNELVEKFNGSKSIEEIMLMLETVEELMYGENDEDNTLVIYSTFDSDEEKQSALETIDKYMSKIYNEGKLEDFEETHFIDTIRGLTLTYENEEYLLGQLKLMKKLTNLFG